MTEQKTYDFEGVILVKKVASKENPCKGCFFYYKYDDEFCRGFFPFCCKGVEGNKTDMIFVEANEPVNKID